MIKYSLICLILLAASALGQSVKLPAEVKGDPVDFVLVKADTDCTSLRWVVIDAGLKLFPPDQLKDTRTAVVVATRAGRYRILAYGAKGDQASEPAVTTVVIGDVPPGPDPPKPPPDPPTPPSDPFAKALREAFAKDATPDKGALVAKLTAFYAAEAKDGAVAAKAVYVKQWVAGMRAGVNSLVGADALKPVRGAIADELDRVLLTHEADKFDDAMRAKYREQCNRVATALGGLR